MQKMFENEVVCHKTVHFGVGVIRAKNERRMIDDGLMIGNQVINYRSAGSDKLTRFS